MFRAWNPVDHKFVLMDLVLNEAKTKHVAYVGEILPLAI